MPLKQVTQQDIPAIMALCHSSMPKEGFTDPSVFTSWFPSRVHGFCYKTRRKKRLIGFIFGVILKEAYYIMCIGVHPSFKRRGLGRGLLSHFLLSISQNLPVWCKIYKENTASLNLFRSFGFQKQPKKKTPEGLSKSFRTPYSPFRLVFFTPPLIDFDLYLEGIRLQERMKTLL